MSHVILTPQAVVLLAVNLTSLWFPLLPLSSFSISSAYFPHHSVLSLPSCITAAAPGCAQRWSSFPFISHKLHSLSFFFPAWHSESTHHIPYLYYLLFVFSLNRATGGQRQCLGHLYSIITRSDSELAINKCLSIEILNNFKRSCLFEWVRNKKTKQPEQIWNSLLGLQWLALVPTAEKKSS